MKRKAKKIGASKRKGKALGRGEMKKVSGGYLRHERHAPYDNYIVPDGDDSNMGRLNRGTTR